MRPGSVVQDSGLNAYREPGEPFDGRALVISRRPFWSSEAEELRWLWAVEECRRFRGEPLIQHLERIGRMVGAKYGGPAAKSFPEARLPYRDSDDEREAVQAETQ